MSDTDAHHLSFGAVCSKCKHTQPPLAAMSSDFFQGKTILCRNRECATPIDYWNATLDFIGGEGIPTILLVSVGAHETFFNFPLGAGDIAPIDLTRVGIPADATLLGISFTSYGTNCVAQIIHPNHVPLRSLPTQFSVYGFGTGEGEDLKGYIEATVAWVQKDEDNISWSYLLDAFEAMASHRWRGVILPAYASFEISLSPLVLNALGKHVTNKVLQDFKGEKSFSSSSALNVLLPILCKEARLPLLPEEIRLRLNKLRKLRNDMVHEGVEQAAVGQELAGQSLCAAVFGLEYLRFIRPLLLPAA